MAVSKAARRRDRERNTYRQHFTSISGKFDDTYSRVEHSSPSQCYPWCRTWLTTQSHDS